MTDTGVRDRVTRRERERERARRRRREKDGVVEARGDENEETKVGDRTGRGRRMAGNR